MEEELLLNTSSTEKVYTEEDISKNRKSRFNKIFYDKCKQIKYIAIDVSDLSGQSIDMQKELYDSMYKSAMDGLYEQELCDAIISEYNKSVELSSALVLLANDVRRVVFDAINNSAENVDDMIEYANNLKIEKEYINDDAIAEIRSYYNI